MYCLRKKSGDLPVVGNRQRSILLCSAAALPFLFASPAFSAPQALDWSGFYAGVTAGAGRSKSREVTNLPCTEDPAFPAGYVCGIGVPGEAPAISAALTGSHSKSGFIGGGEAGYNWQAGPAVYGLEIDLQNFRGASNSATAFSDGSFRLPAGTPISLMSSTDAHWLFTARGRLGYAFDRLLVYGTGGLAFTRLSTSFAYNDASGPGQGSWTQSNTKAGWVAGAGVEWMMTKNWSVKAEYLHVHFDAITASGSITSPSGPGYGNAISTSADLTANIARAGINYKF